MSVLEFSVKTAEVGENVFIVAVTGEVDLHSAPELDGALDGVLALGGTATVVDLGDVSFIDSTVLGVLLRHQRRFRGRGGDLVIVTADRRVLRTFEVTGLNRVFAIQQRLSDGVALLLAPSRS